MITYVVTTFTLIVVSSAVIVKVVHLAHLCRKPISIAEVTDMNHKVRFVHLIGHMTCGEDRVWLCLLHLHATIYLTMAKICMCRNTTLSIDE